MSIKYNKFGEVVSVNGIVTGQHLGAPMQDAKPKRPEDNDVYATEMSVQTTIPNSDELLEEQPKPSGGASSWNDLTDKPFYEETVTVNEPVNIQWDGNTNGLVNIMADNLCYCKISDLVFTEEEIKLMSVTYPDGVNWPITNVSTEFIKTNENGTSVEGLLIVVRNAGKIPVGYDAPEFPETGLYIECNLRGVISTEPIEHTKTVVKKIDEKFLPSDGGGASTVYVTINQDLSTDLSREEIIDYVNQGVNVIAKYEDTDDCWSYATLIKVANTVVFGGFVWEGNDFKPIYIKIYGNKAEIRKDEIDVLFPDTLYLYSSGMGSYCEIIVEADGTVKGVKTDDSPTKLR